MSSPPPRKASAPPPPAEPAFDVLPLLVSKKLVTPEQAERVRRSTRLNNATSEKALAELGIMNEIQITQVSPTRRGCAS